MDLINKKYLKEDLDGLPKRFKASMLNCITGAKAVNIIGTIDQKGKTNAAIFNSALHIGSDPALISILSRPLTVERDTYRNIKELKQFTINSVRANMLDAAHYSSAKMDNSEFDTLALNPEFSSFLKAPYVQGSAIQIGLKYVNEYKIKENGTILLVGEVIELRIKNTLQNNKGELVLNEKHHIVSGGLNHYYGLNHFAEKPYAIKENYQYP